MSTPEIVGPDASGYYRYRIVQQGERYCCEAFDGLWWRPLRKTGFWPGIHEYTSLQQAQTALEKHIDKHGTRKRVVYQQDAR